ncbi:hypothetical protein ACP70R_027855 [Stipagrostis hirtigluma subsp. patula]
MGRQSSSPRHGVAGDEERQPLRGGLATARAPAPPHHGAEQQPEPRRGRPWRAPVRAGLVLCLLTIPAVLLLQRWQAASSPEWVFEAEPPEEDDDQEPNHQQFVFDQPAMITTGLRGGGSIGVRWHGHVELHSCGDGGFLRFQRESRRAINTTLSSSSPATLKQESRKRSMFSEAFLGTGSNQQSKADSFDVSGLFYLE